MNVAAIGLEPIAQQYRLRENAVDLIRHSLQHLLQKCPCGALVYLFNELGDGELARAVDAGEKVEPFVGKTVPLTDF